MKAGYYPKAEIKTPEELLKNWLCGTTCHRQKRSIFWTDGRFVILKHHSHSEYLSRFSGSLTCRVHYDLYDLQSDDELDALGRPCLWRVEGRWKKEYWDQIEKLTGLTII